ncbi:bifunctional RNase H/acid phosphatase [Corynebacterium tapiri]|uniref:Bifunctional RNase H/acid phosphatase n=1 Tax=Corynebacterium tapiri TaxID=1448266 RepID=A0A5C4U4V3_9CORY|nr:bifunctional RNase H/acid phosphatase [Corynebacterium tapiri]TNL98737.1 bifunctional RNase H/acid phosphatase [Corynebacterium tapiri]
MRVFLYADGGSRGNPGVAGSGAVVLDAVSKQRLASIVYAFKEKTTNNVAEYRGLIEGLKAARDLGASQVDVFLDSKLVVEQMTGRWKIKHPDMQKLAVEARKLMSLFDDVSFTWVPRAKNKDADALSNVAMDASAAGAPTGIVKSKSTLPSAPAAKTESEDEAEPPAEEKPSATSSAWWSGSDSPPTRIVLVRHGQTDLSAQRRYAGHRDAQLTELGTTQSVATAKAVAGMDNIAAVLTSPLSRCQHTAEKLAGLLGLQAQVNKAFIECDFGDAEGLTFEEAEDKLGAQHGTWLRDPSSPAPGGESFAEVHARVGRALNRIVEEYRGKTVVVVSHVTPIKAVLAHALGGNESVYPRIVLDVASISVVDVLGTGAIVPAQVRAINDTAHL